MVLQLVAHDRAGTDESVKNRRSREPGGQLTVRVQAHEDHIRVGVHDGGGPWAGAAPADRQNGRGLLIVDQLARSWGRAGGETAGWLTWFEMTRA